MRNIILATLIFIVVFTAMPLVASAQSGFSLVPCGRSDQQGIDPVTNEPNLNAQCTVRHFIIGVIRLINYLISVAAIVAMYQILIAGWNLIGSMGNTEKIKSARTGISNAVVGFGMVVLAFLFVNLLVNGIFGTANPDSPRKWWDRNCIYNITNSDTSGCPGSSP